MRIIRRWPLAQIQQHVALIVSWGWLALSAQAAALQGTGLPCENAANVLESCFTEPIARGLSRVAVVVGGLMFAFGEGRSKDTAVGIIFSVGMALAAVNFIGWLLPG
ncbi:MAG: TrbC/VirB2 family protein [Terriglobales bacterium]